MYPIRGQTITVHAPHIKVRCIRIQLLLNWIWQISMLFRNNIILMVNNWDIFTGIHMYRLNIFLNYISWEPLDLYHS
jgi:hypothetical protein